MKEEQCKILKHRAINSSYFLSKSHFKGDHTQNYVAFQPVYRYLKSITNKDYISVWTSKGLSDGSIKPPVAPNNNIAPELNHIKTKLRIRFDGSCLKQKKVTFTDKKVVNTYIVYGINLWSNIHGAEFLLLNFLFVTIELTKNAVPDKYKWSGYDIGFDALGSFWLSDGGEFDKNVLILDGDISSLVHIDNKRKKYLDSPTDGSDDTAFTTEKE